MNKSITKRVEVSKVYDVDTGKKETKTMFRFYPIKPPEVDNIDWEKLARLNPDILFSDI